METGGITDRNDAKPPRVQIRYSIDTGDAVELRELPFVVGVLADLSGDIDYAAPRLRERKFIEIDRDNFDAVMNTVAPQLRLRIEITLPVGIAGVTSDDVRIAVDLKFRRMEDFAPDNVALQVKPLADLLGLRASLANLANTVNGSDRLDAAIQDALNDMERRARITKEVQHVADSGPSTDHPMLELEAIADAGRLGYSLEERERGVSWLRCFFEQFLSGAMPPSRDTEGMVRARVAAIDNLVSIQLNEILHNQSFQKLEASWRGLHYLVCHTNSSYTLKIRVLNVSKKDLLKDLQRAPEFDSTGLFRKVYDEEFGVLGGQPFAALVGDYEFGREIEDIEMLEKISNIAAAASAPFIAAAAPSMFGLDSFRELDQPRNLSKIFDNDYYVRWKSFRQSQDSQYVGLVLPRILLRMPYGRGCEPVESFDYEEKVDGRDSTKYLWGNAAYAFAAAITGAFDSFGWCAAIRGVEGGGLVSGLPSHSFTTDDGDVAVKCPTEIPISDRREFELADLGFIPLVYYRGMNCAVFFGAPSCQKPRVYVRDDANMNARFAARLEYTLALSRFTHYLKAIMRDKIGRFRSREECEKYLNLWIAEYVRPDGGKGDDLDPKFPLRSAQIEVMELPGRISVYRATLLLRPYFQLEEPTVPLRLTTSLGESK